MEFRWLQNNAVQGPIANNMVQMVTGDFAQFQHRAHKTAPWLDVLLITEDTVDPNQGNLLVPDLLADEMLGKEIRPGPVTYHPEPLEGVKTGQIQMTDHGACQILLTNTGSGVGLVVKKETVDFLLVQLYEELKYGMCDPE